MEKEQALESSFAAAPAPAKASARPVGQGPDQGQAARAQSAELHRAAPSGAGAKTAAAAEASKPTEQPPGGDPPEDGTGEQPAAKSGLQVDKKFERSHTTTVKKPKAPEGTLKLGRKKSMERTKTEELEGGGTRTSKTTATAGGTPQVDIKDGKVAGVGIGGDVGLGKEVSTTKEVDGKKVTTTRTSAAKAKANVTRKDGEVSRGVGGDLSQGIGRSVTEQVGDAEVTKTTGAGGTVGVEKKDGKVTRKVGGELKRGTKTVTTDEDGTKVTRSVGDTVGATGSRTTDKEGEDTDSLTLKAGRTWGTKKESTTDDGEALTEEQKTALTGTATPSTGGSSVGATLSRENKTTTVMPDGTKLVTKDGKALEAGLKKDGISLRGKVTSVGEEKTEKLDEKTTLISTKDKRERSVGIKVGKSEDGKVTVEADAQAAATLYSQKVKRNFDDKLFLKDIKGEAGYEVGKGEVKVGAGIHKGDGGIQVTGTAGAKLTMVGANAKLVASPFTWTLFNEPMDVQLIAGVSAAVLAEANGKINFDVGKGKKLDVNITGADTGTTLFVGGKAGVEVGAKLRWKRGTDYSQLMKEALKFLPGGLDDWLVNKIPEDLWPQLAAILIGKGPADIISATAGVDGSAGLGGHISGGVGLGKGTIDISANFQGTLGLGAGVKTNLQLDYFDGVRFIAVAAMRGEEWVKDSVAELTGWFTQAKDEIGRTVDESLERGKKSKRWYKRLGARSTDFIGEKILHAW